MISIHRILSAFLLLSVLGAAGSAQTAGTAAPAATASAAASTAPAAAPEPQTPAPAPAPAAAAAPTWSVGPIDFAGSVDVFYGYNFNHPTSDLSQLYNFDDKVNQFSLNMAKLTLSHTADPVGFQIDVGLGRSFDIFNRQASEKAGDGFRYVEQAFVSLKPAKAKGFQVDFGKFVTTAGAEVIESQSNWNYSRSLLFSWAIPYYHFGIRTSAPIGKSFTAGVQLVNGWNNVGDNNHGKTVGLTGTYTNKRFAWTNTYYVGPENDRNEANPKGKGVRHLYDTVLLITPPTNKWTAYVNFDYGQNNNGPDSLVSVSKWYGVAGAFHYQPTSKWSFTPRAEWFKDRDGFSTGVAQTLKEFTLTAEYKMVEGLLARLEYRGDFSDQPFFDRGDSVGVGKNQHTLSMGIVAYFGPKR